MLERWAGPWRPFSVSLHQPGAEWCSANDLLGVWCTDPYRYPSQLDPVLEWHRPNDLDHHPAIPSIRWRDNLGRHRHYPDHPGNRKRRDRPDHGWYFHQPDDFRKHFG